MIPIATLVASLREEAADLKGYIAGLPDDLRAGPYGEVYRSRLKVLLEKLAAEETPPSPIIWRRCGQEWFAQMGGTCITVGTISNEIWFWSIRGVAAGQRRHDTAESAKREVERVAEVLL